MIRYKVQENINLENKFSNKKENNTNILNINDHEHRGKERKKLVKLSLLNKKYRLKLLESKINKNSKVEDQGKDLLPVKSLKLKKISNRKNRNLIIKKYYFLGQMSKCNSKTGLYEILSSISRKWKNFIKFYLRNCFIRHLHIRQIKKISELMRQRQFFYDALDDPELLTLKVKFDNNIIKNFCIGICNFVIMFYSDLIEQEIIPASLRE